MSSKADPFVNLADWLATPASRPAAKRGELPAEAAALADRLNALADALDRHFGHRAREGVEEVGGRLNLLAVALWQWARKYGNK
jgi:hypothetical protein